MSGQGREEKGLFPKGMILACVILFLLGIGCVGMNLAAGPSEEKNPMGQIADYRKKEEKKKEAEKKKLEEQKKQKKSTDEKKNADPDQDMTEELAQKYYYQKLSAEEQKYYVNPILASVIEKEFNDRYYSDDGFDINVFREDENDDIIDKHLNPFKYEIAKGI